MADATDGRTALAMLPPVFLTTTVAVKACPRESRAGIETASIDSAAAVCTATSVVGGLLGYAIGALSAGIMTDVFGAASAIAVISALTFLSGALVAVVMSAHRPPPQQPSSVR